MPDLSGPFSNVLTEPLTGVASQQTYQREQVQPSGFGGKTQGIAMFADKLLEGFSRGRRMQYEKSEMEKKKEIGTIDSSIAQVQDSVQQGITDQKAGQDEIARLNHIKYGVAMGVMEGDSEGGDKKKKGGGGKGKEKGKDDQGNPIMGAIKGIFGAMVGPGAQPMAYTPGTIYQETGKTMAFLQDQKNTVKDRMMQADMPVLKAYTDYQNSLGHTPSEEELLKNETYQKAVSNAINSFGGKPTPTIAYIQDAAARQSQQKDPLRVAQTEEARAKTDESRQRAELDKQRALKEKAEAEGKEIYLNAQGQSLAWDGQKFTDAATGKPIEDPKLTTNLVKPGTPRAPQRLITKADQSGNVHKYDPVTMQDLGPVMMGNRPLNSGSPLGRMILSQGFTDDRWLAGKEEEITRQYDNKKLEIENKKGISKSARDQELKDLEKSKGEALGTLDPVRGRTQRPPSGKSAKPAGKADAKSSDVKFDWSTIFPQAGAGKKPNTAEEFLERP